MALSPRARADAFCARFGFRVPVLMGPMAGASPPALAAAVADAGGLGALGALLLQPRQIAAWAREFRAASNGSFQINTWIPDPPPARDAAAEARMAALLAQHGAPMGDLGAPALPDFADQCAAILDAAPPIVSTIMGLWPEPFVDELKRRGIAWFAGVTSLAEAHAAAAAGADALVVAGVEAGGHRGAFEAGAAPAQGGTTFALVPLIADAIPLPVIAAGGIADGRGLAAALALGASAAQVGTALLRTPEAAIPRAWADAIAAAAPEDTVQTRAFSGRLARAIRSRWTEAASEAALPYPLQRLATQKLREAAVAQGDPGAMQMWAGQAARLARAAPAAEVVRAMWDEARALLA